MDATNLNGPDGGAVSQETRLAWEAYHAFMAFEPCTQDVSAQHSGALSLFPAQCTACNQFLADATGIKSYPTSSITLSWHNVQLGAEIARGHTGIVCEANLALPAPLPGTSGTMVGPIAPIAVKKLHSYAAWDYSECINETTELGRFTPLCPYVLRVLGPLVVQDGVDARGSTVAIVQEMAAGPLMDIVAQASMAQKLLLLYQAAVGMSCLHSSGIVHGALTAACFLLSEDGQLRVASAGLTRTRRAVERALLAVAAQSASATAAPFHIKAWSAPELLLSSPSPRCPATDTYAFGITAWEVLAASMPQGEFDDVSGKPRAGWRPDLDALPYDTPPSVRSILQQCWAASPAARPSMSSVALALSSAAEGMVGSAVLAGVKTLWEDATARIAAQRTALGLPFIHDAPSSPLSPAHPPLIESHNTSTGPAVHPVTGGRLHESEELQADSADGTDTRTAEHAAGSYEAASANGEAAEDVAHALGGDAPGGEEDSSPHVEENADDGVLAAAEDATDMDKQHAGRTAPSAERLREKAASIKASFTPAPELAAGKVMRSNGSRPAAGPAAVPSPSTPKSRTAVPAMGSPQAPQSTAARPALPSASSFPSGPRAVITPIYDRNPPVWQTDSTDPEDIPEDIGRLLAHLPPAVAKDLMLTVCVPFYSEDGFALRRGLEALAMQRSDLRRYWAGCRLEQEQVAAAAATAAIASEEARAKAKSSKGGAASGFPSASPGMHPGTGGGSGASTTLPGLPELHVFAIADGWRKADGSYIVSESMMEEVMDIFGDTLDVEQLIRYLEPGTGTDAHDEEAGEGDSMPPDAVLIQFVMDKPADTVPGAAMRARSFSPLRQEPKDHPQQFLHPISLDVTLAQQSVCRMSTPRGAVTNAMAAAKRRREERRRAAEKKRKTAAWTAFLGIKGGKEDGKGQEKDVEKERNINGISWEAFMMTTGKQIQAQESTDREQQLGGRQGSANAPVGPASQQAAIAAGVDALVGAEDSSSSLPDQPVYFTLMIKRENGKKHHSHRWFFEAFAPVSRLRSGGRCRYYFATDCGTLYAPYCLAELIHHMDRHPACAASTGHQRIMDKEDQADPASAEGETLMENVLRNVQGYDFESGLCVFNGMHAQAGFLPVVPGPCGMFRAAALSDAIITQVRKICSTEAALDGLVQGNLKIAEDRILSYLLVLTDGGPTRGKGERRQHGSASSGNGKATTPSRRSTTPADIPPSALRSPMELEAMEGAREPLMDAQDGPGRVPKGNGHVQRKRSKGWQTHWVPTTVFYFESESTLKELVLQRRRWLNGTTAGYIWLLRQPALWRGVCAGRAMSWRILSLSLLQVLVFAITFFMPGIIMVTGYLSVSGLLLVLNLAGVTSAYDVAYPLQMLYLAVAVCSYLAHVFYARLGSSNFTPWIWTVRLVLNGVLMMLNAFVIVAITVLSVVQTQTVIDAVGEENFEDIQVAAAFGVLYACTPFFLSYMHSPSAFKTMLVTFPSYFCFAPTVLADFFSYSVARTDDLSWGTKSVPGTSRSGVGGPGGNQRREAALARLAAARKRVAATAGAGAAGAKAHRASVRALRDGMRRNALAKESSQRTTNTLAVVQTVGSLAIALVNFLLNGILHHYLLTVGAVTAGVSVIVMLASFSYFVPRALYSRTAGSPGERLWSLLNFAGWLVAAGAVGLMWVSDDYTSWLWQDAAAAFATAISGLILVAAARFGACCSCSCGSSSHRAWSRLKEEEEAKGRLGSQGRKGRVAKGKGSTPATDEGSSDTSDSDTGSSAESDIDDDEDEEDGSDGEDGSMAEGPRGGRGKGSYVPPRGTQR